MSANVANTPANLAVIFPRADFGGVNNSIRMNSGIGVENHYAVTIPGAGHLGTQVIHSTAIANFVASPTTPDNDDELQTLAAQIATDWLQWRLASIEIRYESAVDWQIDGAHDIEITQAGTISTYVHRSEWEPENGQLKHAGTFGSSDEPPICGAQGVKAVDGVLVNGTFDGLLLLRDNGTETDEDNEPIWIYDWDDAAELAPGSAYNGVFRGREPGGVYYVNLFDGNQDNPLTDAESWAILLSLTPMAWIDATNAYGNYVAFEGHNYVEINPAGTDDTPGSSADWMQADLLNDAGGWSILDTYAESATGATDIVRQIRAVYSIGSRTVSSGGGGSSTGSSSSGSRSSSSLGSTSASSAATSYQCICITACNGLPQWLWWSTHPVQIFISPLPCTQTFQPPIFSIGSSSGSGSSTGNVCSFGPQLCLSWVSPAKVISGCAGCVNPSSPYYAATAPDFSGILALLANFDLVFEFNQIQSDAVSCEWDWTGTALGEAFDATGTMVLSTITQTVTVTLTIGVPVGETDEPVYEITYSLPLSEFDCSAENTLELVDSTAPAGTYPDEITLGPYGPQFPVQMPTGSNPLCTGNTTLTFHGKYWSGAGVINGGNVQFFLFGASVNALSLQIGNKVYPVSASVTCSSIVLSVPNGVNNCAPLIFTVFNGPCPGGSGGSGGSGASGSTSVSSASGSISGSGGGGCALPTFICATVTANAVVSPSSPCGLCPPGATPQSWSVTFPADYLNINPAVNAFNDGAYVITGDNTCKWLYNTVTDGISLTLAKDSTGAATLQMILAVGGSNLSWTYEFPGGAVNCSDPITLTPNFLNSPFGPGDAPPSITITPQGALNSGGNNSLCDVCFSVMQVGGIWQGSAIIGGNFTTVKLTPGATGPQYVLTAAGTSYPASPSSTCTTIVFPNVNIGACQNATLTFDTTNRCCTASSSSAGSSTSGGGSSTSGGGSGGSMSGGSSSVGLPCGFGNTICGNYIGASSTPICTPCPTGSTPSEIDFSGSFSGPNAGSILANWQLVQNASGGLGSCVWTQTTGTPATVLVTSTLVIAANGSAILNIVVQPPEGRSFTTSYNSGSFHCDGSTTFTLAGSTFDPAIDTVPSTITTTSATLVQTCNGSVCMTFDGTGWTGIATLGGQSAAIALAPAGNLFDWVLTINGVPYNPVRSSSCSSIQFIDVVIGACTVSFIFTNDDSCCFGCGGVSGTVLLDTTVPGNYPLVMPSGVTCVKVEAWGPGGDGCNVDPITSSPGGGGGGGGGYASGIVGVTPSDTYNAHVGQFGSTDPTEFTGDIEVVQGGYGCGAAGSGDLCRAGTFPAGGDGGGHGSGGSNIGTVTVDGADGQAGDGTANGGAGGAGANSGGAGGTGGQPGEGAGGVPGGGGGGAGTGSSTGGPGGNGRLRITIP